MPPEVLAVDVIDLLVNALAQVDYFVVKSVGSGLYAFFDELLDNGAFERLWNVLLDLYQSFVQFLVFLVHLLLHCRVLPFNFGQGFLDLPLHLLIRLPDVLSQTRVVVFVILDEIDRASYDLLVGLY